MDWDLGLVGVGLLLGMSLCFGFVAQLIAGRHTTRWMWLLGGAAFFAFGLLISEAWFGWATGEDLQPNIDGLSFDETLLSGFIKMMGIYPPGSVVQLNDDRYAMVMTVNAAHPLKPRVLVYETGVPVDEALHVDLEREPLLGIRRSLKPAQLPTRAHDYLKPRQRVSYFFDVESAPKEEPHEEVTA